MNQRDQSLQRLFQAAARHQEEPPGPMSFGMATRVLAQWRAAKATPDLAWLVAWFRVALAGACAIMLLSLAWSYQESDADSIGDLVFMNQSMRETSLR